MKDLETSVADVSSTDALGVCPSGGTDDDCADGDAMVARAIKMVQALVSERCAPLCLGLPKPAGNIGDKSVWR